MRSETFVHIHANIRGVTRVAAGTSTVIPTVVIVYDTILRHGVTTMSSPHTVINLDTVARIRVGSFVTLMAVTFERRSRGDTKEIFRAVMQAVDTGVDMDTVLGRRSLEACSAITEHLSTLHDAHLVEVFFHPTGVKTNGALVYNRTTNGGIAFIVFVTLTSERGVARDAVRVLRAVVLAQGTQVDHTTGRFCSIKLVAGEA